MLFSASENCISQILSAVFVGCWVSLGNKEETDILAKRKVNTVLERESVENDRRKLINGRKNRSFGKDSFPLGRIKSV